MNAAWRCDGYRGLKCPWAIDHSYNGASTGYRVRHPLSRCSAIHDSARSRVEKTPAGKVPPSPLKTQTPSIAHPPPVRTIYGSPFTLSDTESASDAEDASWISHCRRIPCWQTTGDKK